MKNFIIVEFFVWQLLTGFSKRLLVLSNRFASVCLFASFSSWEGNSWTEQEVWKCLNKFLRRLFIFICDGHFFPPRHKNKETKSSKRKRKRRRNWKKQLISWEFQDLINELIHRNKKLTVLRCSSSNFSWADGQFNYNLLAFMTMKLS